MTRGLAKVPKERRIEIARLGGQTAQQSGTAHQWDQEEARSAGKKGGSTTAKKYGSEYMKQIASRGGKAERNP